MGNGGSSLNAYKNFRSLAGLAAIWSAFGCWFIWFQQHGVLERHGYRFYRIAFRGRQSAASKSFVLELVLIFRAVKKILLILYVRNVFRTVRGNI